MFILNPHSGIPIYRQLAEQVRRLVAGGQLAPGAALPSVRELALEHAVNPMTISKAYALLENEGVLVRNRGKPMTVASTPAARAAPRERLAQLEDEVASLILAARQLELGREQVIALVEEKWEDDHERNRRKRPRA